MFFIILVNLLNWFSFRAGPILSELEAAGDVYHRVKLTSHGPNFMTARVQLIDGLLAALGKRFADTNEAVVNASSLPNKQSWPDEDVSSGTMIVTDTFVISVLYNLY